MFFVDAWILYKGNQGAQGYIPQTLFCATLADEHVDNVDMTTEGHSQALVPESYVSDATASLIGPHLAPTNRKRKLADGTVTRY